MEEVQGIDRERCRDGRRTVIQRTVCESAGKPVQPQYCSSPKELTIMGSLRVPV